MIRIKLFALFIAFALLALVRPRKCLEMLEAADNWVEMVRRRALRDSIHHNGPPDLAAAEAKLKGHMPPRPIPEPRGLRQVSPVPGAISDGFGGWFVKGADDMWHRWGPNPECPLPPAGWRCTRRAGHDGPCAAVMK